MISEFIYSWLKDIVVLFVIITLVDLIMPKGNMKRYIDVFIGLILIYMVISPFLKLASIDFKLDRSIVESFSFHESDNIDFIKEQSGKIEELYVEKLNSRIKLLVEDSTEYKMDSIDIDIERKEEYFGEIKSIEIFLLKELNGNATKNNGEIDIQKVKKISLEKQGNLKKDDMSFKGIKTLISKELEVKENLIYINIKTEED